MTIPPRHHLVHENFLARVEVFLANSRGAAFQISELDYESLISQVDEIRRTTERRAPRPARGHPMRSVTLILEPPCAYINANARLHHHARNQLTQTWRHHAHTTINAGWYPDRYEHAHITITYRFPTNHRREVSNLQPTSKAIVDGLVDAQLIPDDSDAHVVGPDNRREWPNGTPRVTVTIEETP